ncbi:MAG: hypothetical protein H6969_12055 [Gammaproteobacteria bacterium]|nr:hypothetical protein [Candidatus Competibacteraceae bacterium]MCP5421204.1 hypothetical protein [Gammaproteobacteria bacterium]
MMERPKWFSVDQALRAINREQQLVTFDDVLLFGEQGFLKIHMMIGTSGDFVTYRRLPDGNWGATDILFGRYWDRRPIADSETLQELRLNASTTINSITVKGDWRNKDQEVGCIRFKAPVEVSRQQLVLWHEEFEKLRAHFFPKPPVEEKPLHASERRSLLAIIRALAELHEIKPIKTRKSGDGWRKAAEALLTDLSAQGIAPPLKDPQRLAEKLREAFGLRD